MLYSLTKISKLPALTAAVVLMALSVHGIFLHQDTHSKAGESHHCSLCEINIFHYSFPEIPEFIAATEFPGIHSFLPVSSIIIKTCARTVLRGPPAAKERVRFRHGFRLIYYSCFF